MRRVAASRIYFNNKDFRTNHVVELVDHFVVNHYPLKGEIPMAEWLGGTIIICNRRAYHTRQVLTPDEVATYPNADFNITQL